MNLSFVTLFALCSLCLVGCGNKEAKPSNGSGDLSTAPVDYLSTAAKAGQTMEKQIDTAALNKQIEIFSAQEGRYPTDLSELVTKKYLAKLPVPPFGTKLQYDASQGKVSLVKE